MPPIRTPAEFRRLRALDDLHRMVALEVWCDLAVACDVPSGVLSQALLRWELDRDDEAEAMRKAA
jgi:hypothetical protein